MSSTDTDDAFDFNTAGEQRTIEVIPANEICTLQMTVRPGGVGEGGWLTRATNGASEGLDCEFTVVEGKHTKRKLWQRLTLHGTTPGHETAGEISRNTLRAILESARGIKPDDTGEAAKTARKVGSYGDFNNLRFVARIGVRPPKDGYAAKNTIAEVVTPEHQVWKRPEQVATAPADSGAQPASAIGRPQWAG